MSTVIFRLLKHNLRGGVRIRTYCKKVEDITDNKPVQYSTSKAAFRVVEFGKRSTDRPRYEPHITLLSLVIFMVYFTILREENDIDLKLSANLYDNVAGLEEVQNRIAMQMNHNMDLDNEHSKTK